MVGGMDRSAPRMGAGRKSLGRRSMASRWLLAACSLSLTAAAFAAPRESTGAAATSSMRAPLPSTASVAPMPALADGSTAAPTRQVDFGDVTVSDPAREMARIAFEAGDARNRPFAVVDKQAARLLVFSAEGRLVGATSALLGLARGDALDPAVGRMVATGIPPELRTTPAGRYDTQPGVNLKGEAVIWVDYDAAFAIHRLRPSPAAERRAERLASASPDDNRISLGCVIVTGEFFDRVVRPVLGQGAAVVYVLPEPAEASPGAVAMNEDAARPRAPSAVATRVSSSDRTGSGPTRATPTSIRL